MRPEPPHVVIVGGGFGGIYAANALRRAPVRITLVDRRNHHVFQPLLYQVATAALNPSEIAAPIRAILRRQRNAQVMLDDVTGIDLAGRKVTLAAGDPLRYDFLVLATGATHSYFGNDAWARHAPGLKSVEDALEIRRHILLMYEEAERDAHADHRREWLTFVIVGAGPTGVEMAGALAEISRHTLSRDFRRARPEEARVVLVEGLARVLPAFPEGLSRKAETQLRRLGVEVRTGALVTAIDAHGVSLGEERIAARTVVWAAGVQASPLARSLGAPLDRSGRVLVGPDLSVPGHPEAFVIGDLAHFEQGGQLVPGVAPAAMQGGRHAARSILRSLGGEARRPFRYVDKGSLATIGRAAAVADLPGGIRLSGLPAWAAWLVVHIFFLIGFRNRLMVLLQWAWAYLTHERGARLITGELERRREEG